MKEQSTLLRSFWCPLVLEVKLPIALMQRYTNPFRCTSNSFRHSSLLYYSSDGSNSLLRRCTLKWTQRLPRKAWYFAPLFYTVAELLLHLLFSHWSFWGQSKRITGKFYTNLVCLRHCRCMLIKWSFHIDRRLCFWFPLEKWIWRTSTCFPIVLCRPSKFKKLSMRSFCSFLAVMPKPSTFTCLCRTFRTLWYLTINPNFLTGLGEEQSLKKSLDFCVKNLMRDQYTFSSHQKHLITGFHENYHLCMQ